jgi:GT2 family glycosyltransferase
MKLSVVISSYFIDDQKPGILHKTIESMQGADEILALVTHPKAPMSFAESHNKIASIASGDYIMVIGDNFICQGNLKDLCVPDTITVPQINGIAYPGEWMMVYCMPRVAYEEIGLYDEIFKHGSHWEDTDLWRRARNSRFPVRGINTVNVIKPSNGRTIGRLPEWLDRIEINKKAYIEKWGDETLG